MPVQLASDPCVGSVPLLQYPDVSLHRALQRDTAVKAWMPSYLVKAEHFHEDVQEGLGLTFVIQGQP